VNSGISVLTAVSRLNHDLKEIRVVLAAMSQGGTWPPLTRCKTQELGRRAGRYPEFCPMAEGHNIYRNVNNKTDLQRIFTDIRQDVDGAKSDH